MGEADGSRGDKSEGGLRDAVMPWLQGLAGIASVLAVFVMLFVPAAAEIALSVMDRYTGDWRTAKLSPRPAGQNERIALVTVSEETLQGYATVSPVDRGLLAKLVAAIDAAKPRAIGLDFLFLRATDEGKDAALIEALRAAKAEVVVGALDERGDMLGGQRTFQAEFLKRCARETGYVNLHYDKDLVVRNAAAAHPDSAYPKSFARVLAAAGGSDLPDAVRPISWVLPPPGKTSFLVIPAHQLLAGGTDLASQLEGRIVLVGGDFPNRDRHRTPLAPDRDDDVSGLFIHAQMIAARLEPERLVHNLKSSQERMLLMALAIAGFLIGWRMWESPLVNFIAWTFATAALIAVDAALYMYAHLLLPFTLALLAWFLGVTAGRFLRGFGEHIFARRVPA